MGPVPRFCLSHFTYRVPSVSCLLTLTRAPLEAPEGESARVIAVVPSQVTARQLQQSRWASSPRPRAWPRDCQSTFHHLLGLQLG